MGAAHRWAPAVVRRIPNMTKLHSFIAGLALAVALVSLVAADATADGMQINLREYGDRDSLMNMATGMRIQANSCKYPIDCAEDKANQRILEELVANQPKFESGSLPLKLVHIRALLAGHRAVLAQVTGLERQKAKELTSAVQTVEQKAEETDKAKPPSLKACRKGSDDTKKYVKDEAKKIEDELKKLGSGKSCENAHHKDVDKAKKKMDDSKANVDKAKKALAKAQSAPVDFGKIKYKKLKQGHCAVFFKMAAYKKAKEAAKKAKETLDDLTGKHESAKKAHEKAKETAKKACLCKIQKAARAAKADTKAWNKAHLLDCTMDSTPLGKCRIPPVPKIGKVKVIAAVSDAKC